MGAISGTFVRVKTLADGTPRIELDLQCSLSELAAIGCEPGTHYALARLTQEAGIKQAQEAAKPKGGHLAQWAALRCKEPEFWSFMAEMSGLEIDCEDGCVEVLKLMAGIQSRAELDTDEDANAWFVSNVINSWRDR